MTSRPQGEECGPRTNRVLASLELPDYDALMLAAESFP